MLLRTSTWRRRLGCRAAGKSSLTIGSGSSSHHPPKPSNSYREWNGKGQGPGVHLLTMPEGGELRRCLGGSILVPLKRRWDGTFSR